MLEDIKSVMQHMEPADYISAALGVAAILVPALVIYGVLA